MGERRGAYRALVGNPEGRKPLGRPRIKWEGNIEMDLEEIEWGAWTGLIWLRVRTKWRTNMNTVMNICVP
jgi:hypothetical protein